MNKVFRVDDRLIHGQVVVGWVKRLKLNSIVVANNEVASDILQRNLMELAIPSEVTSYFFTLEEAIKNLSGPDFEKKKYILLVSSTDDALSLIRQGVPFDCINVGGLHFQKGREQYSASLFLAGQDVTNIRELDQMGIKISTQPLPDDYKIDIMKILNKKD